MMSKKKWCVLLCFFIVYLLLGATLFHNIEFAEETKRMLVDKAERKEIEGLLRRYMSPHPEQRLFRKLSDYCGKSIHAEMSKDPYDRKWDFYHSVFFVITVVSTIGYGNLAPTTIFGRVFMIFYGLVGIPMNGIVMVTLGAFFGRSFTKLYQRWKTVKMQYDTTRLGLISQIVLYAVPGFTFFIFLPAVIMVIFEGWPYDVAVYYCFVTLTTIGFGDYVAGVHNVNGHDEFYFTIYKLFLLVWVIGGLGYVLMVLNFITQAMRSKKMHELEHIITDNIKKTPTKIRQELRNLLQEFLFLKVKRVYKGEFTYVPKHLERSQSCPDLALYRDADSPTMRRKRALSECPRPLAPLRIQSEGDLERIDKEKTFEFDDTLLQQKDLLFKVVDALSNYDASSLEGGFEGFSDAEILQSEQAGEARPGIRSRMMAFMPRRRRAISEVQEPREGAEAAKQDLTWYGQEATNRWRHYRTRTHSVPVVKESGGLFGRIKSKLASRTSSQRSLDVEKGQEAERGAPRRASLISTGRGNVLESTSIADFLRALSVVADPEAPRDPFAAAANQRTRRPAIRPNLQIRRTSLAPEVGFSRRERRRFSLRPVEEHLLAPPPYSPLPSAADALPTPAVLLPSRRFSRSANASISIAPIQKEIKKREADS